MESAKNKCGIQKRIERKPQRGKNGKRRKTNFQITHVNI